MEPIRDLERACKLAPGDLEAFDRLVLERVRRGVLTPAQIKLMVWCGYEPVARLVREGEVPFVRIKPLEVSHGVVVQERATELWFFGQAACMRAALVASEFALETLRSESVWLDDFEKASSALSWFEHVVSLGWSDCLVDAARDLGLAFPQGSEYPVWVYVAAHTLFYAIDTTGVLAYAGAGNGMIYQKKSGWRPKSGSFWGLRWALQDAAHSRGVSFGSTEAGLRIHEEDLMPLVRDRLLRWAAVPDSKVEDPTARFRLWQKKALETDYHADLAMSAAGLGKQEEQVESKLP